MDLHPSDCDGINIDAMRTKLEQDPQSLSRLQYFQENDSQVATLPLHDAVRSGHEHCVRFLLSAGANSDTLDPRGHSPLQVALESSQEYMVSILLDNGASPNYQRENESTTRYLEIAIDKTLNNAVEFLLKHNASTEDYEINSQGEKQLKVNYESPLINALWEENNEIFKLLLYHSSALQCYNNKLNSIPHIILASYVSSQESMEALHVYRQFGGNLWSLQPDLEDRTDVPETALQSLKREPCLYQFKGNPPNISVHLEKLMSTPLSLQSCCRIAVFQSMGRNYWKNVYLLPLPSSIIKFLTFSDVFDNEYKYTNLIFD